MTDSVVRWREALLETLRPYRDLPLLLSGGMDSVALYAGLRALGSNPVCFTYRVEDRPSADVAAAARICREQGSRLVIDAVPADRASIERDVRYIVARIGTGRKSAVECAVPVWYMTRSVHFSGFTAVLSGDPGIVEDNRAFSVGILQEGETERWAAYRRQRLYRRAEDGVDASEAMRMAAADWGVMIIQPYALDPLSEVGLSIPVADINSPRQKGIALRAFPDFFGYPDRLRYWRKNTSLQSASGLREAYAEAFGRGQRSVVREYNRLLRESTGGPTLWS